MSKGNLKELMEFPAVCYSKANGYLGIVGLDRNRNELYVSSKATVKGKYAEMLQGLVNSLGAEKNLFLKSYLKKNKVTLVFEAVKYKEDPHIIKYTEDKLVLLAVIENEVHYKEKSYEETVYVADRLGVEVTEPLVTLNNWEEFKVFYRDCMNEDVYDMDESHIEGYVIKCINGFNVKLKMPYYNYWKRFRGLIDRYRKGNDRALDGLDPLEKEIVMIGGHLFHRKGSEVDVITLLEDEDVKRLVKILRLNPPEKVS